MDPRAIVASVGPEMNIHMVLSSVSRKAGGLFDSVRGLSQTLASKKDITVEVFGLEDENTTDDIRYWKPIIPRVFPNIGLKRFGYSPLLRKAMEEGRPDLIHSHGIWMYPSIAASINSMRKEVPHLISLHGMLDRVPLQNSPVRKRVAGFLFMNRHLRNARCLHALTEAEFESIRSYGLKNPICIIPNGIDIPEEETNGLPPWQGIEGGGRKVLLSLGRLHPIKGIPNLLEAWHILKNKGDKSLREWVLVIAGWDQSGHADVLRRKIHQWGLDNVHILGPQFGNEKRSAMRHANGFILPSLSEGLPMAALEAWSFSLPVLMTRECNVPEGFRVGAAFELTPDPGTIAQALEAFFAMPDRQRKEVGDKGFDLVRNFFSCEAVAEKMYQVYVWIISGGSPPRFVRFN